MSNQINYVIQSILPDIKNYEFANARVKLKESMTKIHHKDLKELYEILTCINNCDALMTQSWQWDMKPIVNNLYDCFSSFSIMNNTMQFRSQLLMDMKSICNKYCKEE